MREERRAPLSQRDIGLVRGCLGGAARVLALTGAGISAESGIPTFRGSGGWWRNEDPTRLATPEAFARDPAHVWEWYEYRRGLVAAAEPNAGHQALADLEAAGADVLVATQNVDDLHERAGSGDVVHIHGSLWRVRCTGCGRETADRTHPLTVRPPTCGRCGAPLRPAVVWFGEALPSSPLSRVETFLAGGAAVALVVGTEALFGYIRSIAMAARRAGALLVEVNPARTALTPAADVSFRSGAGEVLPALLPERS